jgi:hypothetical protein
MIDPRDFVSAFRESYNEEFTDDIAKKKLRVYIKSYLNKLPSTYDYIEGNSNDYDIEFKLISKDNKRELKFNVSIDTKNQITVYGAAQYTDYDFKFEIDEIKFDQLLFPSLESCAQDLIKRIDLRVSMKVSGTRLRIASYVLQISKRDLAIAKADILKEGFTYVYTITGERLIITERAEGKLLDSMNTNIFGAGTKLYWNVAPEIQEIKPPKENNEGVEEGHEKNKPNQSKPTSNSTKKQNDSSDNKQQQNKPKQKANPDKEKAKVKEGVEKTKPKAPQKQQQSKKQQ